MGPCDEPAQELSRLETQERSDEVGYGSEKIALALGISIPVRNGTQDLHIRCAMLFKDWEDAEPIFEGMNEGGHSGEEQAGLELRWGF